MRKNVEQEWPTGEVPGAPRIVHVLGALAAGGAERLVVNLALELKGRGVSIGVVALSSRLDAVGEDMVRALREASIPVMLGPTDRLRWATVLWYGRTLRRLPARVIHLHNLNTELAHFLVHRFVGTTPCAVRTIHNTKLSMPFASFVLRHNRVRGTIFCGQASYDANPGIPGEIRRVVPNGVRFTWPVRSVDTTRDAKAKLGLDSQSRHFVAVGAMNGARLEECQKAQDIAIAAWRSGELGKRGARLHLLGDGNLRGELEGLAAGDDSITFHGIRPDVETWLLASDAFLMPSRYEGLPIAAIEALGTGLPAVFTRIPPLVGLGAEGVAWCEASDVDSLEVALGEVLERGGVTDQSAALSAREKFGIGRVATEYLHVYEDLGFEPDTLG